MDAPIVINRILMVCSRQVGEAVLSTVICNTLRRSFPQAVIDIVLSTKIAPLFQYHLAVSHIMTFDDEELHHRISYLKRVYKIVHDTHYDVILDMCTNPMTVPFSVFSLSTPFRIGMRKHFSSAVFNYRMGHQGLLPDVLSRNLLLLKPLEKVAHIKYTRHFSLFITKEERNEFRQYMVNHGIDFCHPIMLVGVTAKVKNKSWNEDRMVCVLRKLMNTYPHLQIIFNYAPGEEETSARRIYEKLECKKQIFIDIQAHNLRQLAAMTQLVSFYFGNEGGTRHIAHAMGVPSFVICSPRASKRVWIPQNEVPAESIAPSDYLPEVERLRMSDSEQYNVITADRVWRGLNACFSTAAKKNL